ncbi:hypothetical protein ACB316_03265 [Aeromonas sanarellii]|uniref:SAM-dependent methyltransferase n=1 Tax=Aeromonas caviae TaxID=648 RepID=UPI000FE3DC72|nr:SAM-dependent methyltransferase [Aeromonas caviae]MEA9421995.1 hypothetical protein [Aeromonas caviae]RWT28948.1 SAM-dependent methyltransferase [Aeromonas caviae]
MQADFLDAHCRHWADAEFLRDAQRLANADHLYGMAAECGLKRLMEMLKQGPLIRADWVHVMEKKPHNAWSRYQVYLSGHANATKFPLPDVNPFADWSASQRYAKQSSFDAARVQKHQAGAKVVNELIRKAQMEGLI